MKICKKHPEFNGRRTKSGRDCYECHRLASRDWHRRASKDPAYLLYKRVAMQAHRDIHRAAKV
jgi:hypothetical protein